MPGDVELADWHGVVLEALDQPGEPVRERDAAGVNTDQAEAARASVAFEDLVSDASEGTPDVGLVENAARPTRGLLDGRRKSAALTLESTRLPTA
jgi:hypothetical protein